MATTVYYCPCLVSANGQRLYLPPGVTLSQGTSQAVKTVSIPGQPQKLITDVNPNQGSTLKLDFTEVFRNGNAALVLDRLRQIWNFAKGRTLKLYIYSDRCFKWCALESLDHKRDSTPLLWLTDLSASFVCESDVEVPDNLSFIHGYETDYPYAAMVGNVSISGDDPTVDPDVEVKAMQVLNGIFVGMAESATPAGEGLSFVIGGTSGGTWKLVGVQITGADNAGATGSTVIRFTDGTNSVNATVAAGSTYGSLATSGAIVSTGGSIYASILTAGLHSNIQFAIYLQGA